MNTVQYKLTQSIAIQHVQIFDNFSLNFSIFKEFATVFKRSNYNIYDVFLVRLAPRPTLVQSRTFHLFLDIFSFSVK